MSMITYYDFRFSFYRFYYFDNWSSLYFFSRVPVQKALNTLLDDTVLGEWNRV